MIKVVPETHKVHKQVLNLNGRSLILIGPLGGLSISGAQFEVKRAVQEKRRSRRPYSERVVGNWEIDDVFRRVPVCRNPRASHEFPQADSWRVIA
jgi:hypothetical protein